MKKWTADEPETQSVDFVAENIAKLKTLFPEIITEGRTEPRGRRCPKALVAIGRHRR